MKKKKIILSIITIIILTTMGYFIYTHQNINITDNIQDVQKQNNKVEVVEGTKREETKTEKQEEENFWEKNDCQVEQFKPVVKKDLVNNYSIKIGNLKGIVYEDFEYQGVKYILAQIGCADYTKKIFIEKKDRELSYDLIITSLENFNNIVKHNNFNVMINIVKKLKKEKKKLEKDIRYPDNCIDGACYNYLFISEDEISGIKYFVIGYDMTL